MSEFGEFGEFDTPPRLESEPSPRLESEPSVEAKSVPQDRCPIDRSSYEDHSQAQ